jgi:hypothetical protein
MSWNVLLLRLPDDVTSVHELPADCTPDPLGRQYDVLDTRRRLAVTAPFGQTWPGLAPSRET